MDVWRTEATGTSEQLRQIYPALQTISNATRDVFGVSYIQLLHTPKPNHTAQKMSPRSIYSIFVFPLFSRHWYLLLIFKLNCKTLYL